VIKSGWAELLIIAWRYFMPPSGSGRRAGVRLAVVGVSMGVLAMVAVMAVMNGLQQGYIRTILEVESGHLQLYSQGRLSPAAYEQVVSSLQPYGLRSMQPRIKQTTMMRSDWGNYKAVQIIGMDDQVLQNDASFSAYLNKIEGSFPKAGQLMLGSALANVHHAVVGSFVSILVLPDGSNEPDELSLEVSGIFESGYYAFDSTLALINLEQMIDLLGSDRAVEYTIKFDNMQHARKAVQLLREAGYDANSWQDYNRAFFSALQLEKSLMMWMLQLIFIVTAINIYQGRRRMLLLKKLEISILRILGVSARRMHLVFVLQGTLIGLFGTMIGMVLGLLVAFNINTLVQSGTLMLNFILQIFNIQVSMLFDSSLFYLQSIPVVLLPGDLLQVAIQALVITTLSGYIAGRQLLHQHPLDSTDR
jgi:lipoprotein-releasing system permease protein